MNSVPTRFRGYQLGIDGSSFSYWADGKFTIIEARLTNTSRLSLIQEMTRCNVTRADTLQITSWDNDHCTPDELKQLLSLVHPRQIQTPGYDPMTNSGKSSLATIRAYRQARDQVRAPVTIRQITPAYVTALQSSHELAFREIIYHPRWIDPQCANNNSTVTLFRRGIFNVLSLGDVESPMIASALRRRRILSSETDIMILAHHGADNGFTTKAFLNSVSPRIAICSSNYANQYDHPRQEIRDLLWEHKIDLFTTKTGDVVIKSIPDMDGNHSGRYRVINLKAGSTEVSSAREYESKKARILSFNSDTLRQRYAPRRRYPRR